MLTKRTIIALLTITWLLAHAVTHAATNQIGGADGSFETDLSGTTTSGDVTLVSNLGSLQPTEGVQALLMTTAPDAGDTPPDADVSTYLIENFTIDATYGTLRVDYNFLTDEPTPSATNDQFVVTLFLITAGGDVQLLATDTFDTFFSAPWTGYNGQTGWRGMVADVSAYAGTGDVLTLELLVEDVGDGRRDSAVLIDSLRLVEPGFPDADADDAYIEINSGDTFDFDGSGSTDDVGIVSYEWDFGNGSVGSGQFVSFAGYTVPGIYNGSLTVTDIDGNTDTAFFTVVVDGINRAPAIISPAITNAAEDVLYQYQVLVDDPEIAFGDVMTYSLTTAPAGMSIDAATGLVSWTPTAGVARNNDVTVQVTDSEGASDSQSYTITIGPGVYIAGITDDGRIYTADSNGDGTFSNFRLLEDIHTSNTSRGAVIADFNGDNDFDLITGYGANPSVELYYYERDGSDFETPVYLGPVGGSATPTGTWLMDMAAEDFNNDGNVDIVLDSDSVNAFYGENAGQIVTQAENFFASDFETGNEGWGGQISSTSLARDDTTANSGTWSMRVFATNNNSALSIDINPSTWLLSRGSTVRFDYRIPAGTPVGLLFNVTGFGWMQLGGTASADPGTFPVSPLAVTLIDDDTWRTAEVDVYQAIRAVSPTASQATEFQWWTNTNATTGQQFWFDDFRITRPRMTSGFDFSLLPDTGGNGRGMDAGDVNNDGNMDFARGRSNSGFVYLYTGDGDGNFTTTQVADPGADPYGVLVADFDDDGNADIIANNNGSGDPYFFAGNGDGTFQAGVLQPSLDTNNYASLAEFDFNDDGNRDVVASTYSTRTFRYYPGNGDGTFGPSTLIGNTTIGGASNALSIAAPAGRVLGQPFAIAGGDQNLIDEGDTVNFDATDSYDDGNIISYDWNFGDGNSATGLTTNHTFNNEGNFVVVLTITDDEGFTDRTSLVVTVRGTPPTADAGGPYVIPETLASNSRWPGRLDGTASTDTGTSIARYEWDFDDSDGVGVDATGPTPRTAYTTPGVFTVTLTVYDEVGLSDSTTTTVTAEVGAAPVADLAGPAVLDEANASLSDWAGKYDGNASTDVEGVARYDIDWGDGNNTTIEGIKENFEDGELATNPSWTASGGSAWNVFDGVLNAPVVNAWRWLQDLSRSYTDFELEVDFRGLGATNGYMGIAFRNANASGSTNSMLMYSQESWDFWRFYDYQTNTAIQDAGTGWDPDIWYHLRLRVVGSRMQLYVTPEGGAETLQLDLVYPKFASGGIGLLANNQELQYDNVVVRPIEDGLRPTHVYDAPGNYTAELTVTDHGGQTDASSIAVQVTQGASPVADAGGPYTLGEGDAYGSRWAFVFDGSASSDDTNVERYSIDFGDGTSYTTGMASGSRSSYFVTGTDLYGLDTADATLQRIVATEANTRVDIFNLETNELIATNTINRFGTWNNVQPGDGVYFKVKASKPVLAYFTDLAQHSAFMPSLDGDPVGKEFLPFIDENSGFYVFAYEDALVNFYNSSGTLQESLSVPAGQYRRTRNQSSVTRQIVSTGRISAQTVGTGGSYTTVPSANGSPAGDLFYFATPPGDLGAFALFAHDAADVEVFDMDTGASLLTRTMAAGELWFEASLPERRLRVVSTADVEVWGGATEGGLTVDNLGDDLSVTTGRNGTEFVLHNLADGIVIFAPNDGTDVDVDSGAITTTLQRDEFLRLAPTDFPSGSGVHTITATQPIVVQTIGSNAGFNDEGTYLGGVTARHDYEAVGNYTLTLTVTDNAGQTNVATTNVDVVASDPPVPVIDGPAIADETFAIGGDWTVEFDAGNSTDDFGIFSYEWDFGDGNTATGVNPTHVYNGPGTYTVTLTVTDHAGQQTTTTFVTDVTFGAGPTADAGGPYVFGEEAASFGVWTATLDGSGSTDDAGIFDYFWMFDPLLSEDFEGGPLDAADWTADAGASVQAGRLVNAGAGWGPTGHYSVATIARGVGVGARLTGQVEPPAAGTGNMMWGLFSESPTSFSYLQMPHAIYFNNGTLRIYEDGSNRGTVGTYTPGTLYDVRIDLRPSGADYFIRETGAATWTALTNYTSLNRSASPLRVGASVNAGTFQFDNLSLAEVGDGLIFTREYTEPGSEGVTLTVRDNALQADSDATTITIEGGDPPVADAGGPYTAEVGSFVVFDATASSDDNAIQSYDWVFGDRTGGPVGAGGSATADLPFTGSGPRAQHFYQQVGTYNVDLTVTDNILQSDSASTTIDVIVGDPPVAAVLPPTQGAAGGPAVYFDASPSTDDFGIVEYRWDFDADVDRDGDGDFTNDVDGVGKTPFHTFPSATGPAGPVLEEDFAGGALDSGVWTAAGGTQAGGVLSFTGASAWTNNYFYSVQTFERSGRVFFGGRVRQDTVGTQRLMWGLYNAAPSSGNFNQLNHAIYFDNGTLRIYEDGSNRGAVGTYTFGTQYDVRINLKPSGADYFIRETGAATWTALTSYTSLNRSASPVRVGATVNAGLGEFDDVLVEDLGPLRVTLTVEDGAGQTDTTEFNVAIDENLPPDVITVPWVAFDTLVPHETYNGKPIHLKGIVRDADPVTYQWDFGDGTQSAVMDVTDPFDLSVVHTYPAAPSGTPFTATLTVTDDAGNTGSAVYRVVVRPLNLTTEINVAIDEGLWYLHQEQTRCPETSCAAATTTPGYTSGYWTSGARASATASAIQAFEVNGHLETVNHQSDPYAETVMRGLRQLFRDLGTVDIGTQTFGEPDTNNNGIGIQTGVNGSGTQPIYQGGQVMDAIASSGTPLARTVTGGTGIVRRSYFDILTDMADQFAWGQTEQGAGGAWRYSWNSSIDNSAAQWGAIGILAAEDVFGIPAPLWVKERNQVWLDGVYAGVGFGYTSGTSRAGTPSGMVQLVMDDQVTSDMRWRTSEQWIAENWTTQFIINPGNRPYYPFYALTKAMRLAKPEPVVEFRSNGLDWFMDDTLGLARTLVDDQMPNGQFPGSEWITTQLRSAWGVIILSRSLFVQPPVADAGRDRVWGVDIPLDFDGSGSFHLDPFRSLVLYEWDFDGDGNFDFSSPDPTATFTYPLADYPEATLPQTVIVTLRVTDNNVPALTATDTAQIIIAVPPHPPVADAGGPYSCTAGLPCPLDGSGSLDIDPTDFISRYEWDLDGFPFEYLDATGVNPEPIFDPEGVYNIGLRVFDNGVLNDLDSDGEVDENERLSDVDFSSVNVVENLPPVAEANGPYVVDEGSAVFLDSSGSSDPNGDPLTFEWDLDDDGQFDDALGPSPSFTGVDDGVFPVGLRVTDSLLDDTDTSTVTVNNVAPAVTAGNDQVVTEGDTVDFNGSFTDPGAADTHTIEWDFGDGSAPSIGSLTPSHVFQDDGVYVVTLTVTDDDGGVGSDTLTVTVNNVPPSVDAGPDATLDEGDTFDSAGSFTDPGANTWTATVDYGDGSGPQPLALNPDGSFALSHTYADNGIFTVTVSVTDDDGGVGTDTVTVTVNNVPPIVEAGADQNNVALGTPVDLDPASFTDAGVLDTHTAQIDWGDGTVEAGALTQGAGNGTVAGSHSYAAAGNYTVTVTVTDDDGAAGSDTFAVEILEGANDPPVVDAGPDATLDEGDTFVSAGSFVDADSSSWTATVDYGDGSGVQPLPLNPDGSFALSHTYADDGVFTVTVSVSDDDGGVGTDSATVTVNNVPPVVDAGPDATLDEGDTFVSAGSFSDPGTDTWTATVDYGDGSGVQPLALNPDGSFALSHTYADDGVFTVTVSVSDDDGGVGTDSATVTINNVPPVVDAGPDATLDEGDTFVSAGSFGDPGADTWTATVDYGDGSGAQPLALNPDGSFALNHTYADNGLFTVTVSVSDDDGGVGTDSATVTVNNVPPIVDAGPDATLDEGDTFISAGSFSDPGADTWTATVDYGEGAGPQPLALNPDKTFSLDNVYEIADTYTVTVTVTDDDGGTGTDSATVIVNASISPSVDAGPDASLDEGETFVSAGSFADADSSSWTATVDYGDGSGVQPLALNPDGSFALNHTYADNGVFTVIVSVTDDDGGVGADSATVTVNNVAPVVDAGADQNGVALGTPIDLDPASFTDAGVLDTHTAQIDWGDGTVEPGALTQGAGNGSVAGSHSYAAAGNYTVTVTVTDNDGGTGSDTFAVEILEGPNDPPQVDAGADETLDEGDTYVSAGSFVDADSSSWTATVDYGDGSGVQPLALNPDGSFALSHTYADNGLFTVTVSVTDDDGGVGTDSATVTVNNVAPVVDAGPDATLDEGDTFVSAGSFSDPGADTWTATVDYGEGAGPQPLALNPDKTFSLDNVYEIADTYTVTVTVTDDDGGVGIDSATVTVTDVQPEPEQTIFDLSARAKSTKIDLTWTPVAGADAYNVYRSLTPGGPYDLIAAGHVCSYCAYADFGLTNDITYYYVVTSVSNGLESLSSNEASATPTERRRR